MSDVLKRFSVLYQKLDAEAISNLDDVYALDIKFVDPVGHHKGLEKVRHYFQRIMTNVNECRFEITSVKSADDSAYVHWTMHFSHPRLNSGKPLSMEGLSHLIIENDKVSYQRDFYDMGAMLYEHIPLLGRIIRWLKSRL